jgi:hypothetical protein
MLLDAGYRVDCSVTPGVDWSGTPGAPSGAGGPDYRGFPGQPYFLSPQNIKAPVHRGLLEVPVTIATGAVFLCAAWAYRVPILRAILNRIYPLQSWLSPGENDLPGMLRAAHAARITSAGCVELMVHSSELMPGGSPNFPNSAAIERLYASLEVLFEDLSAWCRGMTLAEFHARMNTEATP